MGESLRAALTIFPLWGAGIGVVAQFGKMSIAYNETRTGIPAAAGIQTGQMVSIVCTTVGLVVARVDEGRAMLVALGPAAIVSVVQTFLPPYPLTVLAGILYLIQRNCRSATWSKKVLHRSVRFTLRSLFPVGNPAIFPYVVKLM